MSSTQCRELDVDQHQLAIVLDLSVRRVSPFGGTENLSDWCFQQHSHI